MSLYLRSLNDPPYEFVWQMPRTRDATFAIEVTPWHHRSDCTIFMSILVVDEEYSEITNS